MIPRQWHRWSHYFLRHTPQLLNHQKCPAKAAVRSRRKPQLRECASSKDELTGQVNNSMTSVTLCACARRMAKCIAQRSNVPPLSVWTSSIRTVCDGRQNQPHSGQSHPNVVPPGCDASTTELVNTRARSSTTGPRSRQISQDAISTVSVRREPLNADLLVLLCLRCHRIVCHVIRERHVYY